MTNVINGKQVLNTVFDRLTLKDLKMEATVALIGGTFIQVATYEVGDDEAIQFGYGDSASYADARGRIYMGLYDGASTPALIAGEVKFTIENKNDDLLVDMGSYPTAKITQGSTDERARYPFPVMMNGASPRRIIKIYMKADASATLTKANSSVQIDITRTNLR